ncbi:MAG: RNA polymerase sigma factor [Myxococcales bacterium FL481]|nr:MAG: RNA polymerase sigma factor [Myxococcales bacterium FL481]
MQSAVTALPTHSQPPKPTPRSEYLNADDWSLVRRACAGDERALRHFYNAHQAQVRGHLFRLLGPDPDIDDMVQTVFTNAFLALGRFKGQSTISTWLYRITANSTHNLLRQRFRRDRVKSALRHFNLSRQAHLQTGKVETRDEAFRVLSCLHPDLRETFVLYHYEGRTLQEISQILAKPISTVGDRLSRARKKLKEIVAAT